MFGLRLPLVESETDLVSLIVEAVKKEGLKLQDGDVLVLTSKLVLKSHGLMTPLSEARPGLRARLIHRLTGKDPVETELVLRNSRRVLAVVPVDFLKPYAASISKHPETALRAIEGEKALLFVEMPNGIIASDAGLDFSNVPPGYVITGGHDFDMFAREIRARLKTLTGSDVAVVIADTEVFVSNGKLGSIDLAVGAAGIEPMTRCFGDPDLYGRPKFGGLDLVVDELCAAAALLMRQTGEGVPAVLIRGLSYERSNEGVGSVLVTKRRRSPWRLLLKTLLLSILVRLICI